MTLFFFAEVSQPALQASFLRAVSSHKPLEQCFWDDDGLIHCDPEFGVYKIHTCAQVSFSLRGGELQRWESNAGLRMWVVVYNFGDRALFYSTAHMEN
ncbi:MAG: hypothetical protein DMF61_04850 [Blastocatellia bacterium AA13]|nr:MAG: hypothetical protein DMF61_04850 [Blastocatellia bacterium AA13]